MVGREALAERPRGAVVDATAMVALRSGEGGGFDCPEDFSSKVRRRAERAPIVRVSSPMRAVSTVVAESWRVEVEGGRLGPAVDALAFVFERGICAVKQWETDRFNRW